MKFSEIRQNTHQTHLEDVVLYGKDGLDELNARLDFFESQLIKGQSAQGTNVSVKIDGCLAPHTVVLTNEGDKLFLDILKEAKEGKIFKGFGRDDKSMKDVEVDLAFPRVNLGHKKWVEIEFENDSIIHATKDHPFSVNGKYVEAAQLKKGDNIDEMGEI